jgi:hypothetical protein
LDLVFKQGTLDLHSASCIHQQENLWTGYFRHSQSQSNLRQSLHQNNFYSIPYVLPCLKVGCNDMRSPSLSRPLVTFLVSVSCESTLATFDWVKATGPR